MLHFATYLDINYLVRFLPMYWSIVRHCELPFLVHVLCMDSAVFSQFDLIKLNNVRTYRLDDLLAADHELAAVRDSRAKIEFYFTCTAAWVLYLFEHLRDSDRITYIDSDLFFYAPPESLFDGISKSTILVSEHRFSRGHDESAKFGKFNVAFLSFPQTVDSMRCIKRWRTQCIEWCYDRCEDGKFADQKYLDEWPFLYSDFRALSHPGANVGPWNVHDTIVEKKKRHVVVNDFPLVFYHFEQFRCLARGLIDSGLGPQGRLVSSDVARWVHQPYVQAYIDALAFLRCNDGGHETLSGETRWSHAQKIITYSLLFRCRLSLTGQAFVVFFGRAFYLGGRVGGFVTKMYDRFRRIR